jgi:hypothetical protein
MPVEMFIFVSNNSRINEPKILSDEIVNTRRSFILHDNTGAEFGAYQAGLEHARKVLGDDISAIILNDTFGTHVGVEGEFLAAFLRTLIQNHEECCVVGRIDQARRRLAIGPYFGSRWVRSNLIGIDYKALQSIDFKIYDSEIEGFIKQSEYMEEFFCSDLNRATIEHISNWLFVRNEWSWYGAEELSATSAERLSRKARSVLQELFFSLRLEARGVAFLDTKLTKHELCTALIKRIVRRTAGKLGLFTGRASGPPAQRRT